MIEFVWHEERVPSGLPVRQVHGWLADRTGRFLLQVTVERDSIAYLGHQVVTGDPVVPGPYVQVRLFGIFPVKSAC